MLQKFSTQNFKHFINAKIHVKMDTLICVRGQNDKSGRIVKSGMYSTLPCIQRNTHVVMGHNHQGSTIV